MLASSRVTSIPGATNSAFDANAGSISHAASRPFSLKRFDLTQVRPYLPPNPVSLESGRLATLEVGPRVGRGAQACAVSGDRIEGLSLAQAGVRPVHHAVAGFWQRSGVRRAQAVALLTSIDIDGPDVKAVRNAAGRSTWLLGKPRADSTAPPRRRRARRATSRALRGHTTGRRSPPGGALRAEIGDGHADDQAGRLTRLADQGLNRGDGIQAHRRRSAGAARDDGAARCGVGGPQDCDDVGRRGARARPLAATPASAPRAGPGGLGPLWPRATFRGGPRCLFGLAINATSSVATPG